MAYLQTQKSDFDSRLATLLPNYSHAPPDARIIELLRTNTSPTAFERKGFEITLSKAPSRIAELDSLIHATTSLLDYLTKDRSQALANQADAKKILSPSRRLPPEVLTEIFIRCWSLYGRTGPPLDPRAVPWTLTHVCRKWRKVAIATPEIWSSIHLDFGYDKFVRGSQHKAAFMLGMILDRARPHDLNVFIDHKDDISTHPACAVLLPSVRYWKSLEVEGVSCDLSFLSPCRGFFDRLETAKVRGLHHGGSEAIDIFAVAPRLRSFTKTSHGPFLLPANLVEFDDTYLFNVYTCTTLRRLVNIETLSLSCNSYSSELPRIHLSRLSQLKLTTDLRSLGTLFVTYNQFDLPSLTHLKIWFLYSQPMIPPQVPQPILSSTVTSLTLMWFHCISLKLSASDFELDLSSYCRLPNLRCLTVGDCPNINPFLGALSIHPGRNVIFPKMSKLDIKYGHEFRLSEDVLDMHILVELAQSRRDQGALRKFRLAWQRGLVNDDADTRSRWQQLSAPGGRIQISASIKDGLITGRLGERVSRVGVGSCTSSESLEGYTNSTSTQSFSPNAVLKARLDSIELNAMNGFLIDQLIQDVNNKRTDAYGGSVESRARSALEVIVPPSG
ncbi:uncharacterized protein ARMOST_06145 [Armillaria ostoyae]|uniref:NADH:flavin oxidoreductase/NADH oxidase N-terminal domain-containing protein n=1 Tax=Armillaria ostoyae TaxID=47428 RepID=A0A284R266_ARMOS|nr:uncharacterized protein ARMOST_06145 [Armillaria ostoyae]